MNLFIKFLPERSRHPRACLGCLAVFALCLAKTAFLAAATAGDSTARTPEQKTVLVLGDSLAAGHGVDPAEAFPTLLQQKINEAGWNFHVINAGVSGDTTAGGLRRIEWLLKRKIDVLVLELGANDGLRGLALDAMKSNLQSIIDRTREKYPKAQIVIVGMRMPPNLGDQYAREFQKVFPELAQENQAALIPFLLEGVGGTPDLNLPDRIHPTAEGQKVLAGNVWKILRPVLEEMNRTK